MVIAPKVILTQRALAVVGAAKLATPNHQRVVEHTALLEVTHERGGRLVGLAGLRPQAARQAAVLIPAGMVKLDESNTALGQAPRLQAVRGESARIFHIVAVLAQHMLRLAGDVGHLRDRRLHAECHLVLRNA